MRDETDARHRSSRLTPRSPSLITHHLSPHKLSLIALLAVLCVTSSCQWAGKHFGSSKKSGSYLVLELKTEPAQLDQNIAQTLTVMKKRCFEMDLSCTVERRGSQIRLEFPGVDDPERVKQVLLSEGAKLELRAVVSPPAPAVLQTYTTQDEAKSAAGTENDVLPYFDRELDTPDRPELRESYVVVERTPIVTGSDVTDARAIGDGGDYRISFQLNSAGAERFGAWTGSNINRYLAIVLNEKITTIPVIKTQISNSAEITGRFTKQAAEDLAMVLRSGDYPARLLAIEEGTF